MPIPRQSEHVDGSYVEQGKDEKCKCKKKNKGNGIVITVVIGVCGGR